MYRKSKKQPLKTILFIIAFVMLLILICDITIYPLIRDMSMQEARAKMTYIINESVNSVIGKDGIEYQDLISFEKDENGKILAMKTDSVKMNELKSKVSLEIQDRLTGYEKDIMYLPLGNLLSSAYFAGKGPKIKFYIKPCGVVESDYSHVFENEGINQTNHRVMIDISVSVYLMLPIKGVYQTVYTSICVSDTIIVGEVPQAFTNVQNFNADDEGETISDEIMDFGANNHLE